MRPTFSPNQSTGMVYDSISIHLIYLINKYTDLPVNRVYLHCWCTPCPVLLEANGCALWLLINKTVSELSL